VLDNSKYSGDEFVANGIDNGHFVFALGHFSQEVLPEFPFGFDSCQSGKVQKGFYRFVG
jgi:hypothetical protein